MQHDTFQRDWTICCKQSIKMGAVLDFENDGILIDLQLVPVILKMSFKNRQFCTSFELFV